MGVGVKIDSEINISKQVDKSTEKSSSGSSLRGHAKAHFEWDGVKYHRTAVCRGKDARERCPGKLNTAIEGR